MNLEKRRARQRKYMRTEKGRRSTARNDARRKSLPGVRLQKRAHGAVNRALKNGTLIKPTVCSRPDCDSTRAIEAHHVNYLEPLIVRWLCSVCHKCADRLFILPPISKPQYLLPLHRPPLRRS